VLTQCVAVHAPSRAYAHSASATLPKVAMSAFEPKKYINYKRIEDNLNIIRKRLSLSLAYFSLRFAWCKQGPVRVRLSMVVARH
jgi:hypothetical protein